MAELNLTAPYGVSAEKIPLPPDSDFTLGEMTEPSGKLFLKGVAGELLPTLRCALTPRERRDDQAMFALYSDFLALKDSVPDGVALTLSAVLSTEFGERSTVTPSLASKILTEVGIRVQERAVTALQRESDVGSSMLLHQSNHCLIRALELGERSRTLSLNERASLLSHLALGLALRDECDSCRAVLDRARTAVRTTVTQGVSPSEILSAALTYSEAIAALGVRQDRPDLCRQAAAMLDTVCARLRIRPYNYRDRLQNFLSAIAPSHSSPSSAADPGSLRAEPQHDRQASA